MILKDNLRPLKKHNMYLIDNNTINLFSSKLLCILTDK